jgi:dolichyl-diphosphooligosaccharide--protein glycosyltransferase
MLINLATLGAFLLIMYLSVFVRLGTLEASTILDYDPWWHYRHAVSIYENGMQMPKWDILSYYPPGRPFESSIAGWEYTMAVFFKIGEYAAPKVPIMEIGKWSPLIMVALTTIPAFLLGRLLSNNLGGLLTALFATLTPTFIGVSMAGYCDSDAVVVFYSFLTTYAMVLLLKKRKWPYYIFTTAVVVLAAFNWFFSWYIPTFFLLLLPILFIFRIVEQMLHRRGTKVDIGEVTKEVKKYAVPIVVIMIVTNVITTLLGMGSVLNFIEINFGFLFGKVMLVNISVAELQNINILTKDGFLAVAGRVGLLPTLLTFFFVLIPSLIIFKIYKKEKVSFVEIFLFLLVLTTFYMILKGVRFSLLFSVATAISAGYVVGNVSKYVKKTFYLATILGLVAFLTLLFVSDSLAYARSASGMEVSSNWIDGLTWLKNNADKDSLIVTWWDPGHIITGFTGLKVHADGAHCSPDACIPYNHNIRIQDMGRIFSVSDENESVSILNKYKQLTPEQCQAARDKFGSLMPADACNPVTEMYIIASNDLIGKYHWMSYFGLGEAKDFFQLSLTNVDQQQGILTYSDGVVSLVSKEDGFVPVYNGKFIIKNVIYYDMQTGKEIRKSFTDATNAVDGLLYVDPSYRVAIFMQPGIQDSIFTRMYFWNGEGLKHFELVHSNSEMKIFKVIF